MTAASEKAFIQFLKKEAKFQATLNEHRLLPGYLDPLTSCIGHHPVAVLAAVSFATAVLLRVLI